MLATTKYTKGKRSTIERTFKCYSSLIEGTHRYVRCTIPFLVWDGTVGKLEKGHPSNPKVVDRETYGNLFSTVGRFWRNGSAKRCGNLMYIMYHPCKMSSKRNHSLIFMIIVKNRVWKSSEASCLLLVCFHNSLTIEKRLGRLGELLRFNITRPFSKSQYLDHLFLPNFPELLLTCSIRQQTVGYCPQ